MKGHNTLNLNLSTVMEAMQEYFDKRYSPKIKVTNVKGTTLNGVTPSFEVEVEDLETLK